MRVIKTLEEAGREIQKLWNQVDSWKSLNLDINRRRVINASPAEQDHDYIIKAQLDEIKEEVFKYTRKPSEAGPTKPRDISFSVKRRHYGMITLEDIQAINKDGDASRDTDSITELHCIVPSVDETDLLEGELTSPIDSSTDPHDINWNTTSGRLTSIFEQYDFLVMNNIEKSPDPDYRSYEIVQLTEKPGFNYGTIKRAFNSITPTGEAHFGSKKSAHPAGTKFYKLEMKHFTLKVTADSLGTSSGQTPSRLPERFDMPWPSRCCAAVVAAFSNNDRFGNWKYVNLGSRIDLSGPQFAENDYPPAPGLRTLNGASYFIPSLGGCGGLDLAVGGTADATIQAQDFASVRTIYAYVKIAPENTAATKDCLNPGIKIQVNLTKPWLLDDAGDPTVIPLETLYIFHDEFKSYQEITDPPRKRQMPYMIDEDDACDTDMEAWPRPIVWQDGELDFIIEKVGDVVAGQDLMVIVQT